jgi:hypothetical protein
MKHEQIDWSEVPQGYDYAITTESDWNGGKDIAGTVRFARKDESGRLFGPSGFCPQIGPTSWRVMAVRPGKSTWNSTDDELPPVGTVCEVLYDEGWHKAVVVGCHPILPTFMAVAAEIGSTTHQLIWCGQFRPIQSDRDKWVEAAMQHGGLRARDGAKEVYGNLYDAGLAKLPE